MAYINTIFSKTNAVCLWKKYQIE